MTTQHAPTPAGIARAMAKVAAILPPTPLLPLAVAGQTIWCKAESLQPVGAFKIRGAWHRLTELSDAQAAAGVVGVSSGNHAQGVAWAARRLGIAAVIVMPNDAPQLKLDATRALGAEVVLYDRPGGEDRDAVAARLLAQRGGTLVHAFADPWVIEGQGTVGLELAAQLAARGLGPVTRLVAPCGGGGLSAGLALACPEAQVVPVEPEGWDDVAQSLAAGAIRRVGPGAPATACDALQTPGHRADQLRRIAGPVRLWPDGHPGRGPQRATPGLHRAAPRDRTGRRSGAGGGLGRQSGRRRGDRRGAVGRQHRCQCLCAGVGFKRLVVRF